MLQQAREVPASLGWAGGVTDRWTKGQKEPPKPSPGATGSIEAFAEAGAAGASALRSLGSPQPRDCISGLLVLLVLMAAGLRTAAPASQLAELRGRSKM